MKKLILFSALFFAGFASLTAQDHTITVAGQLGWSVPGGSGVSDEPEDLNLDGGIEYGIDILYHIKENIGVGIVFNRSVLAGTGGGDIDLFGARFIGAKGLWFMKPEGFSPFAGLSLGVSQLLTPEWSIIDSEGNVQVIEEQVGNGFGIMPEAGIRFGKFYLSAQYVVPVSYTVENVIEDKSMGVLNINIGWRQPFSF